MKGEEPGVAGVQELQELQEAETGVAEKVLWLGGKMYGLKRKLMGRNQKQELGGEDHSVTPELL
jgi:hypothetical protein